MARIKGNIPTHAHPDNSTTPVNLTGKFNVKWPDGTISVADVKVAKVHALRRDDVKESGLYAYFEGQINGMAVIYNLNEVELREDEVVRCLTATKKTKAA